MSHLARSLLIGGSPNKTLIFGHTHALFISNDGTIINSDSWVEDNPLHNTYIKIDDKGNACLNKYVK